MLFKSLGTRRTTMLRLFSDMGHVGCTVSDLNLVELKRLGLSETASSKRAVLKTPLTFPKPRAKRRA
jgi:hypothetical protein